MDNDERIRLMAKLVARIASGIKIPESIEKKFSDEEWEIMRKVANEVRVEKRGLLYCGLCGKGSFTRRGLYLHIKRHHLEEIQYLIKEGIRDLDL